MLVKEKLYVYSFLIVDTYILPRYSSLIKTSNGYESL